MTRLEAWIVHISTILVGVSGLIYGVMRYLMNPVNSFSVVNHPWQPSIQHFHVLVAPAIVFAFGLIWKHHVYDNYKKKRASGRRSGISMILTMVPMILSGYLIQVSVIEFWRNFWIVIHCVTSMLWLTGYLSHQIIDFRRKGIIPTRKKHLSAQ